MSSDCEGNETDAQIHHVVPHKWAFVGYSQFDRRMILCQNIKNFDPRNYDLEQCYRARKAPTGKYENVIVINTAATQEELDIKIHEKRPSVRPKKLCKSASELSDGDDSGKLKKSKSFPASKKPKILEEKTIEKRILMIQQKALNDKENSQTPNQSTKHRGKITHEEENMNDNRGKDVKIVLKKLENGDIGKKSDIDFREEKTRQKKNLKMDAEKIHCEGQKQAGNDIVEDESIESFSDNKNHSDTPINELIDAGEINSRAPSHGSVETCASKNDVDNNDESLKLQKNGKEENEKHHSKLMKTLMYIDNLKTKLAGVLELLKEEKEKNESLKKLVHELTETNLNYQNKTCLDIQLIAETMRNFIRKDKENRNRDAVHPAIGFENPIAQSTHIGNDQWIDTKKFNMIMGGNNPKIVVRDLCRVLFPTEILLKSTITGRPTNKNRKRKLAEKENIEKPKELDPVKILAIRDTLVYYLDTRQKHMDQTKKDKYIADIRSTIGVFISDIKKQDILKNGSPISSKTSSNHILKENTKKTRMDEEEKIRGAVTYSQPSSSYATNAQQHSNMTKKTTVNDFSDDEQIDSNEDDDWDEKFDEILKRGPSEESVTSED